MNAPFIRVIREHKLLAEVPLTGSMLIGRLPDNDLVLDDELVSGRHGRLDRTQAGWRYTDLGSMNGSIVAAGPTLRRGQSALLAEDCQLLLGATVLDVRLEPVPAKDPSEPGAAADLPPAAPAATPATAASPAAPPATAAAASVRAMPASSGTQRVAPAAPPGSPRSGSPAGLPFGRPRVLVVGEGGARTVPLRSERAILGRGSGCDVRVEHPSVSTQHAEIAWEAGRWVLRDLSSRNGTRVGIKKVAGAREIRNNAHIILGEADLLFVDDAGEGGAEGSAPAPQAAAAEAVLAALERDRLLTRSQAQQARAAVAAGGVQLGEILVGRGWMSPGQWTEALSEAGSGGATPRRGRARLVLLGGLLLVLAAVLWLMLRA